MNYRFRSFILLPQVLRCYWTAKTKLSNLYIGTVYQTKIL